MKGPPSKGPLDNPTLGQDLEALHAQYPTDYIDPQLISRFNCGQKIDAVETLIG